MIIMCDLAGGHTKPTGNTQVIGRFRSKIHRQFSVRHLTLVGVTRQQYQEPGALPTAERTRIVPWCSKASVMAMAKPNPVPPVTREREGSLLQNRSNT